jgi:NTE family protein
LDKFGLVIDFAHFLLYSESVLFIGSKGDTFMNYDLVFEGGGAKGMVFVGAMQEFEARGHKYGRLLGTSAGAITATLLAAAYSSAEMLAALNEKLPDGKSVFTSFMALPAPFDQAVVLNSDFYTFIKAINIPLVPDFIETQMDIAIAEKVADDVHFRHLFSFVGLGGWYSADNFLTWIHAKLNSGTFNGQPRNFGDMTLKQYFEATGTELSLVASDTTGQQMLVLNHITAPACPVIWATRMSMSIPLLWQEVIWQAAWGTYIGRDIQGHSIVDGGLLSNFPIELFLSDLKDVTSVMGEKVNDQVLGFLIDEDLAVPNSQELPPAGKKFDPTQLQTIQRISRLVDTTLSARDKMIIDSYSDLVVHMPAKGYGTTEFDMTDQRRNALVDAGQQAMREYFDKLALPTALAGGVTPGMQTAVAAPINNTIDRIATKILK